MTTRVRLGDRSAFPELLARAYLAHAGVSPLSEPVQSRIQTWMAAYAQRGIGAAIEASGLRTKVRQLLAELIGCAPDDVGLVQSTTAGVVAVARSIAFRPGERIVTFAGEFPANVTPWRLLARDLGLEHEMLSLEPFLRSSEEGLFALENALARGVRLVAVSAVQFQTGLRMPIAAMAEACHRYGAQLFVDAIQGLGAVPIDVRDGPVDYLVAGGHKFLMGLEGAGMLYVSPEVMPTLSLGLAGWTGHEDAFSFLSGIRGLLDYERPLIARPSFVEQGAVSVLGYAGLEASLEILLGLGVDNIFAHVTDYLDQLEAGLVELGFASVRPPELERRSASLCLVAPDGVDLPAFSAALALRGVIASTPDGHLRFAPHWPNNPDEIAHVVRAVRECL